MPTPVPPLNLGIVAHVDAGKTSLTERLLFDAGVIDAPGSVDAGTTRTDSMDLERRRGITIRASVTSFETGGRLINLIDTPGHPDFIAEVERSLVVLDAAVLVISAVEGVQPQTVVIWRALTRIGVPTIVFINKIDRSGSDVDAVTEQVRNRLTDRVVPLARAQHPGTKDAQTVDVALTDESVVVAVAEADERIMAHWAKDRPPPQRQVRAALRRGTATGELLPLLCGSALTGAGADSLRTALTSLLPATGGSADGEAAATCFAVDRDERGRRAWLRMWSGTLAVRDRVTVAGQPQRPVTELAISRPDGLEVAARAEPGQIAVVRGPTPQIGDQIGTPPRRRSHSFPPATLHALVEPADPADRAAMFTSLTELADEDPLIGLRINKADGEAEVSLHGEVQKEVLATLMADRFGIPVRFSTSSTVCIERVRGSGTAVDEIHRNDNPYLAGIGLRIEPLPIGSGVRFDAGTEPGRLPRAFCTATEDSVREALNQGLNGWRVTDCLVTMISSQYVPPSSVGGDFRKLAPVVVMAALAKAGTRVCWPIDRFELEIPEESLGVVMPLLGKLGAAVLESRPAQDRITLEGNLPSEHLPDLAGALPDLTSGEGILLTRLDHYAPAPLTRGKPPSRRRTGWDPLDRQTWFRQTPRGV